MANLDAALDFTFAEEGGFSNNPNDHGGKTMFGITSETWTTAIEAGVVEHKPIEDCTKQDARAIYEKFYWFPWLQITEDRVATKLFDAGVNNGVGSAIRLAVRALNLYGSNLTVTSIWTSEIRDLVNACAPEKYNACVALCMEERYWKIVSKDVADNGVNYGWDQNTWSSLTSALEDRDENSISILKKFIKSQGWKLGQLDFLKGWLKRARRLP